MNDEIHVHVVNFKSRFLYMRYRDPMTGKMVTRSTKTSNEKEARKIAGKWEAELREGRYKPLSKVTWAEFRAKYETEVVPGFADKTATKVSGVFDAVERILSPGKLSAITSERLSYFTKVLRKEEMEVERRVFTRDEQGRKVVEYHRTRGVYCRSESTIKGILATLKSALNWAKRVKMLHDVPEIEMPKRAKGAKVMKGRPITGEEYERLIAAVPDVRPDDPAAWRWLIRGLWLSGLRLGEATNLWWDSDSGLSVDFSGRRPMLRIPAEAEKGFQDRLLPMAPEFAEMLREVPESERTGRVFPLPFVRNEGVSNCISQIGEKAGVKVDVQRKADGTTKIKYATAHDLRRAFCEGWAARVMPQILMQLARHENIETTLRYYVGRNAEATADVLWSAVSNTPSNTARETPHSMREIPRTASDRASAISPRPRS